MGTDGAPGALLPLDDTSLACLCQHLDAKSLAALQLVNKQAHKVAGDDGVWRHTFERSFPFYYQEALRRGAGTATPWREVHAQREQHEKRWQTGALPDSPIILRGHPGAVLAAIFLDASPDGALPEGLVLAGGLAQPESFPLLPAPPHLTLWQLPGAAGARLLQGRSLRPQAGTQPLGAAVFDLRQRLGTADVVCSTTGAELDIIRIVAKPADDESDMEMNMDVDVAAPGSDNVQAATPPSQAACGASGDAELQPSTGLEYRKVYRLVGPTATCPCVKLLDDIVAAPSFDATIRLFRLPPVSSNGDAGGADLAPEPEALQAVVALTDASQHPPGHPIDEQACVNNVVLADGARRMVSGGNDLQVKLWDVEAGRVVLRLAGHEGWVWPVEALGEGLHNVVTGGTDGSVRLWDLRAGRQAAAVGIGCSADGSVLPVSGLAVRPDERYLAVGCFDHRVHVVDLRAMRALHALSGHTDRVSRLSGRGDDVLSPSFDCDVRLWRL